MLQMSYEYKLKPSKAQSKTIDDWLAICRKVYNFGLAERRDWIRSRKCPIDRCSLQREYIMPAHAKRPSFVRQCKALAAAKKDIEELKRPHTHILQQALRQLEAAFVGMWEYGRGFPRFKRRMRSMLFPQLNAQLIKENRLNVPKLGWVKFRQSRPIPDGFNPKQLRIVRRASGYYAILVLQSDVSVPSVQPHGHAIGIDLGLEHFLATSDGELVSRPRFFVDGQRRLKVLQRQRKRKAKGSRQWRKIQRQVARHHEYLSNARKDFHFKLAHWLCDRADTIYAEDLNVKGLAASMLSKHVLDAAWGQFLSICKWVCFKRGKFFGQGNPNGSSQECPECHAHVSKDLSVRVHKCPECGYTVNRDVAAAQIILQRGNTAVGQIAVNLGEGKVSGLPVI